MNPFDTAPLGKTNIRVTRLGIGGGALGGLYKDPGNQVAEDTVKGALRLGLNFFDTAPLYGYGRSESRLGRALTGFPRDSFILASKVGRLLVPENPADLSTRICEFDNAPPLRPVFDFSRDGVIRSVEQSLMRLCLDWIDVLHIHDPDDHYEQVVRETYPTLLDLRDQGIVRAVSVGMNQPEMLVRFAKECRFDCFLLAGRYTLLDQSGLKELLPLSLDQEISIVIGGPFNSGILATGAKPEARFHYQSAPKHILEKVDRIEKRCSQHNVPLKAAALQFPLAHPAVASIIPGCRSPQEVAENSRLISLQIPGGLWRDLKRDGLIAEEAPIAASA